MSSSSFFQGFQYAFKGLAVLWKQRNAKFHFVAAIAVILIGWYLNLSQLEWVSIVLCIGLVFAAEAFNTAIELLCDHVTPERHPKIGMIKDVSAAGVLIMAIAAGIVGLTIFLPKII